MKFLTRTGTPLAQSIVDAAETAGNDDVSRREFLATKWAAHCATKQKSVR